MFLFFGSYAERKTLLLFGEGEYARNQRVSLSMLQSFFRHHHFLVAFTLIILAVGKEREEEKNYFLNLFVSK